ncbi:MFS transporter, partial [Streptomyces sp.]|uniref:MFS transporter n=1 Tax=Streptomyces sp. TaxID=1931 RepID=UPI002F419DF8
LGDQVWFVALGWAASQAGSTSQTSLIMTCASVPRAALLLFGGALADRLGALKQALISQSLRVAIMVAGTVAVLAWGADNVWLLITVAGTFGAVDAMHMPAAAALPPHLLPHDALPAGQGAVQTLQRVASVIGAPLGGAIVAIGDLQTATAVNAALFALALALLWKLPTTQAHTTAGPALPQPTAPAEGTVRATWSGLRYVATDPVLGPILLTVTMLNLVLTAPLNLGTALLAAQRGWGAAGFSWTIATFAAGAVAGAAWTAGRSRRPETPAAAGLRWVAAGSVFLAAIAAAPNLPTACAAAACLGVTTGPAGALLLGFVQIRTDPEFIGRVMALVTFSAIGLAPVSFALFGTLTDAAGVRGAFTWSAAALATTTALAYTSRRIRTAAIHPQPTPTNSPPKNASPAA